MTGKRKVSSQDDLPVPDVPTLKQLENAKTYRCCVIRVEPEVSESLQLTEEDKTFRKGEYVYVRPASTSFPGPKAIRQSSKYLTASQIKTPKDEFPEVQEYANEWIGRIRRITAEDVEEPVYIIVQWVYTPSQLRAIGVQPPHDCGKCELFDSDHIEVISAQAIDSHVQITHIPPGPITRQELTELDQQEPFYIRYQLVTTPARHKELQAAAQSSQSSAPESPEQVVPKEEDGQVGDEKSSSRRRGSSRRGSKRRKCTAFSKAYLTGHSEQDKLVVATV